MKTEEDSEEEDKEEEYVVWTESEVKIMHPSPANRLVLLTQKRRDLGNLLLLYPNAFINIKTILYLFFSWSIGNRLHEKSRI